MPHPQDWKGGQMPCSSGGEGGGVRGAQLELTDACIWAIWQVFHSFYDIHVLKAYMYLSKFGKYFPS